MKGVSEEEAKYYLSLHDFNIKSAIIEYEEDVIWEKAQANKDKKKVEKERKRRHLGKILRRNKQIRSFIKFISLCFPRAQALIDPYANTELDAIPDQNNLDPDDGL